MNSRAPVEPKTPPRIGVVTVSYGSGASLQIFLSSLRKFEGDGVQVVVVDNKPDSDNVRSIAELHGAEYVPLPDNPGYGAGMNAGVGALNTTWADDSFDAFFFCNPDVRFLEAITEGLATTLLCNESAGSIGPKLLNEDGTTYPSARNLPSISTGIGHAAFSKIWPTNPWTQRYHSAADYGRTRNAGSLSGAAVMVKESVYHELGGWDEAYFLHFEDIDLGWRIGKLGYTNVYSPQFAVEHTGAHSTMKHPVQVERAQTESAIRFLSKRYSEWWNFPLRQCLKVGLKARLTWKLKTLRNSERIDAQ